MNYDHYQYLEVRKKGRIAFVTLSRPESLNACLEADHREMAVLPLELAADDDVDVIVATGAGRAFSVGGHVALLKELTEDAGTRARVERDARTMILSLMALDKPLVVALNGVAMGGGLAFALMGDVIIAEEQTKVADGHVLAGIAAGDGGVLTWPLYAGLLRSKRWLLTGGWITAEEMHRIGLVTEVVGRGQSLARATEFAEELAALSQPAIRSTKRALNQWMQAGVASLDVALTAQFRDLASPAAAVLAQSYYERSAS